MGGTKRGFKKYLFEFVDGIVICLVLFYVANEIEWSLLFTTTTVTGGDMASHFPTAAYLKSELLPKGRLIGWYPGNFCGFPLFQFYFPFPFFWIVFISLIVPLEISFKLISVLGIFLLPLCSYFAMRLARQKFPTPALAAVFTLPFLFSEGNSMWGGNILSNLAGEFSFQIAFGMSIVFLLSIYRNIYTSRYVILNGLLLGIIGLTHGVGLIFAVLVPLFFLIWPLTGIWKRAHYLLRTYGLALGVMALWFFPFLAGSEWSTKFNLLWHISDFKEVFPEILWPFLTIAIAGTIVLAIHHLYTIKKKTGPPAGVLTLVLYLWFAVAVAVLLFETAYELNVVDIRFLPYAEFIPMLIAAITIGYWSRFLKGSPLLLLILLLGTGMWINNHSRSVSNWAKWNYSGFEHKGAWNTYHNVNTFLKGNESDPRVVYEHSPLYNRFGTIRAFENLPYFSGRSTIEGLYMQSSITAPFAFYLQSEISSPGSYPLPQYDYSHPDLDKGVKHLRLLNISHFITISNTIKQLARKHEGLELAATIDDIEIFKVNPPEYGYAVPLPYHPVLSVQENWRYKSYQWFRNYDPDMPHILFIDQPAKLDQYADKLIEFNSDGNLPPVKIKGEKPIVESRLAGNKINIETSRTGWPLLVKVSYHPNWQCEGAVGPFLISPSFMLIIPMENTVRMYFRRGSAEWVGIIVSALTVMLCLLRNINPVDWLLYRDWKIPYFRIAADKQKLLLILCWVTVICLVSFYSFQKRADSPVRLKQKAMRYYSAGDLDKALPVFDRILSIASDTAYGDDANYFQAISHWRKEDYEKAAASFLNLIKAYPNSQFVPESLYHIILCEKRLGRIEKTEMAINRLTEKFSENRWTEYARQQIKDIR